MFFKVAARGESYLQNIFVLHVLDHVELLFDVVSLLLILRVVRDNLNCKQSAVSVGRKDDVVWCTTDV